MKAGQPQKPRARINVKLAQGLDSNEIKQVLTGTPGIRLVTQLFPAENDEEMLRMYILDVDSDSASDVVERLQNNPHVESAHETAPRKLIR
jgi:hypothetical protein